MKRSLALIIVSLGVFAFLLNASAQSGALDAAQSPTPVTAGDETRSPARGQDAPVIAVASEDRVQKVADADLQFDVPKNWKLEQQPGPAGNAYRVTSNDGASFAIIPVDMDELADRVAGIRAAMQKEAKSYKAGVEKTGSVNELDYATRTDTIDGGATIAEVGTIGSNPPVIFIRSGAKVPLEANAATLDRIFQSVKRLK